MSFAVRPIGLVKSAFVFRQTISSDATNYVLRNAAITAGWDGIVPLDAEVTVSSGIVLSADSTSLYGFDTGTGFPAGTTLKLVMPAYVCGMGGAGGSGGVNGSGKGVVGLPGGAALRAQYAISIDALGGTIAGGGGGGGRGTGSSAAGGGGRSGRTNSGGNAGTFSSGGNGVAGGGGAGGSGGTTSVGGDGASAAGWEGGGGGGGWGAAGGRGDDTAPYSVGGAGGAAVVGNSYITWINTGTRYGSIT